MLKGEGKETEVLVEDLKKCWTKVVWRNWWRTRSSAERNAASVDRRCPFLWSTRQAKAVIAYSLTVAYCVLQQQCASAAAILSEMAEGKNIITCMR